MAKVNNPRVGTMECPHCDQKRSVHVTSKGAYKGYLYSRCPSCPVKKVDQSRDDVSQTLMRQNTAFDAGFESLATEKPEPKKKEPTETPLNSRGSEVLDPEKPQTTKPNRSGLALVAGAVGLTLIILGVKTA